MKIAKSSFYAMIKDTPIQTPKRKDIPGIDTRRTMILQITTKELVEDLALDRALEQSRPFDAAKPLLVKKYSLPPDVEFVEFVRIKAWKSEYKYFGKIRSSQFPIIPEGEKIPVYEPPKKTTTIPKRKPLITI